MVPAEVSRVAPSRPRAAPTGVALAVAAWVVGLLLTLLLAGSPVPLFGFRSPALHLVLDTADACVALLVAYLVHGRFLRRRHWQDRLLAQGLLLLAVAGLALTHLAGHLPGVRPGTLDVWLPLVVRVLGAVCVVLAALADGRPVRIDFARRRAWLLPVLAVLVASATLWAARDALPVAVPPSASPQGGLQLVGHPVLLVAQACSALCFFVASVAFAAPVRPPRRRAAALARPGLSRWPRSRGSTTSSSPRSTPSGSTSATCSARAATCCCSSARPGSCSSTGRLRPRRRSWRTGAGSRGSCTTA